MKFLEIGPTDKKYIKQIIEIEKEAFGENGGVDEWILKPIIRYGKTYILLLDEEVIGVAEYIRKFTGEEVFLYGISIKKGYRKHGYGKKILKKSIEEFRKYNIKKITLTVSEENLEAIELYKKLGFKNQEYLKDEYGEGIDRLFFVLEV